MPVSKTTTKRARTRAISEPPVQTPPPPSSQKENCCGVGKDDNMDFGKKILLTLVGVLLAYGIVFLGTLIRNNIQSFAFIGKADRLERTIRVEATGKVTAQPDIARTTIGMLSKGDSVSEAQQKNTEVMNTLILKLRDAGVDREDIQTANYNIYPRYRYTEDEGRVEDGYDVSQSVTVKIRNLEKASTILAIAGEVGANNVGGLEFTIDDKEVYLEQAREAALEKLADKANALSRMLGVRLVQIVSYDEFEAGSGPELLRSRSVDAFGLSAGGPAPQIESGTTDISLNVGVTFEIQ